MLVQELTTTCDQLFREGRFIAAAAECDKVLARDLSAEERSRALQLKAEALVAEDSRWGTPALAYLKEALSLVESQPDEYGRVLSAFTAVYAAMGSNANCRKYRNQFIELMKANESPELKRLRPRVEYNLAIVCHEVDLLEEALTAYTHARIACQHSDEPAAKDRIAYIDHNLVDVFQELEQFEEAQRLMDLSYPKLPEDIFGAQMRNRRAIHAMYEGDLEAARLWVEAGLGHPSCDLKTRAALTLTKAKLVHMLGQDVVAHDLTSEALRLAAIKLSSRLARRVCKFRNLLEKGG
jgi:tetratricopeptide (TPR) repeat protein